MKRICKDCGCEFELTSSEAEFYTSRNLKLPRRCKSCRRKAKDPRFRDLRDVMRDTPTSKSAASGRDITRTGGDAKSIAAQYLNGLEENLNFSPEINDIARRHFGSWEDFDAFVFGEEQKKP